MQLTNVIDVTSSGHYEHNNYSVEDPTTSLTQAAEMWASTPTRSGERVTARRALALPAVWQAVSLISGDLAKLPIHLYKRDDVNGRERLRGEQLEFLVNKTPNGEVTAFKFWRRVFSCWALYNNAYVWVKRDAQRNPVSLWPILTPLCQPMRHKGVLFYRVMMDDRPETVHSDNMLHFEGICIDDLHAECSVQSARESFGLALARQGYASDFFKSGGRIGGTLKIPTTFTETGAKELETGFRKMYEVAGAAFKTFVASEGVTFEPGQFSPEQSQVTEGTRESNRDVARRFNLHPSKLGEEHKSAYSSKAEDNRDYLDTTLSPYLTQTVEELAFRLFSPADYRADEMYYEHNTDRLLQLDALKRAQQYEILRRSEVISSNEARARENLPPRTDGGGDDYANPNTKSNSTTPVDNEQLRAAHREMLVHSLHRVTKSACEKLARLAAKPTKFRETAGKRYIEYVGQIVTAVAPILQAHAAATTLNADDLVLVLESRLHAEFAAAVTKAGNLDDDGFRDKLTGVLKHMVEFTPDSLATTMIPGG